MRAAGALRLVVAALVANGCGRGPQPAPLPPPPHRVLVVGWDGASFRHIDPLVAAGRMPNLQALLGRGLSAPLRSTIIPISSAAWTSLATGFGPGQTGVYSFFAPLEGSYELRLVDSRSNQRAPLWRRLTARGRTSIVFGVPLTYPPEPILGTLVAGMLSPFDADYAWPPGLAERLRERGFVPDLEAWREDWEATWGDLERQLALKEEILGELLDGPEWSLAFVCFKSLDVLSHRGYGTELGEHLAPLYERLDAILGRLIERVGPRTDVLVLSDHGFRAYPRGFDLHVWLIQSGFAVRRQAPTPTAVESGPLAERMRQELDSLLDELDLDRTRAFAMRCEGNFGSVRLNLRGREPRGTVSPAQAPELLSELAERLRAHPWIQTTWRTAELYPGPHRQALPDLVFEALPDVQVFAEPGERVEGPYAIPVPDHDRWGILAAAGPSVRRLSERCPEPLDVLDVTPTVLALLREPLPPDLPGRVPLEWLDLPAPPRRGGPELLPPPAGRPFTPAELHEVRERLGRLGYGE